MKLLCLIVATAVLATAAPCMGWAAETPDAAAPYNQAILEAIQTMPKMGGYSAGHEATRRLGTAVTLAGDGLAVEPERAQPSYCSGATYLVFLKAAQALVRQGLAPGDAGVLTALLIQGQRDGQGVWGRWNANGPGTARLFYELKLGPNFTDFQQARAGDFMKVFWSDAVGRREHGHSVIFLDTETVNGVDNVRFWSSNIHVGYSEKVVPRARIKAALFSRLMHPGNLAQAASLGPKPDPYLSSLLNVDSSFTEACQKCGVGAE